MQVLTGKTAFIVMLVGSVALASGCQWVKPTESGAQVALVKPALVANCEKLGSTVSIVKARVGIVQRKKAKVADELVTLAKNEAGNMGGNTIITRKAPEEGRQTFEIYSCQ